MFVVPKSFKARAIAGVSALVVSGMLAIPVGALAGTPQNATSAAQAIHDQGC